MGFSTERNTEFVPGSGGPVKSGATSGYNVETERLVWADDQPFGGTVAPVRGPAGTSPSPLGDNGQLFLGVFLLLGFYSFLGTSLEFRVNLFDYWKIWIPSVAVYAATVTWAPRGRYLLFGSVLAATILFGLIVANNHWPFAQRSTLVILMATASLPWGVACWVSPLMMRTTYWIAGVAACLVCLYLAWVWSGGR